MLRSVLLQREQIRKLEKKRGGGGQKPSCCLAPAASLGFHTPVPPHLSTGQASPANLTSQLECAVSVKATLPSAASNGTNWVWRKCTPPRTRSRRSRLYLQFSRTGSRLLLPRRQPWPWRSLLRLWKPPLTAGRNATLTLSS